MPHHVVEFSEDFLLLVCQQLGKADNIEEQNVPDLQTQTGLVRTYVLLLATSAAVLIVVFVAVR